MNTLRNHNSQKRKLSASLLSVLALAALSSSCKLEAGPLPANKPLKGPIAKPNCDKGLVSNLRTGKESVDLFNDQVKHIKNISNISCNSAVMLGGSIVKLFNKNPENSNFHNSNDGDNYTLEYDNPKSGVYAEAEYSSKYKNGVTKLIHVQSAMIGTKIGHSEGFISFDNAPTHNTWAGYAGGKFNGTNYPYINTNSTLINPTIDQLNAIEMVDYSLAINALKVISKEEH